MLSKPKKFKAKSPVADKNAYYLRKYGISLQNVEYMTLKQGGKCAICDKKAKLEVDHIHGEEINPDPKLVRQLLCKNCNILLGHAFDSPEILRKALIYVSKYQDTRQELLDEAIQGVEFDMVDGF